MCADVIFVLVLVLVFVRVIVIDFLTKTQSHEERKRKKEKERERERRVNRRLHRLPQIFWGGCQSANELRRGTRAMVRPLGHSARSAAESQNPGLLPVWEILRLRAG
jgi:flagellar biosynthesis/type III secretory pathway M-ring protein FliF/YscJ